LNLADAREGRGAGRHARAKQEAGRRPALALPRMGED
jgi:hypothetical protein